MRKWIGLSALVVLLAIAGSPTRAAEFVEPSKNVRDVNIAQGQAHRNLYTAGRTVNINSDTAGDLYAAGASINLNGKVEQDLNATGGSVLINAAVGGDVRVASGSVNVNAPIGGDLLTAAGTVNLGSASTIAGDLVAGGTTVTVDSPVNGSAKIGGNDIRINSVIKGDVIVTASKSLTFGPNAVVLGKIDYRGTKTATVEDGARIGTIKYTHLDTRDGRHGVKKLLALGWLIKFLGILLVGALFIYLRRRRLEIGMRESSKTPLVNLLIGIVALAAVPVIGVILFITLVGYYVGALLLGTYILLLMVSYVLGALYMGAVLVQLSKRSNELDLDWLALVVGVLAFAILSWIPILGALIKLVFILAMFGSLVKMMRPAHQHELK